MIALEGCSKDNFIPLTLFAGLFLFASNSNSSTLMLYFVCKVLFFGESLGRLISFSSIKLFALSMVCPFLTLKSFPIICPQIAYGPELLFILAVILPISSTPTTPFSSGTIEYSFVKMFFRRVEI